MKRWGPVRLAFSLLVLSPALAQAVVIVAPSSVTVAPGETSAPVTATLSFGAAAAPPAGAQTLAIDALPSGVSTLPSPVSYVASGPTASTVWRFLVDAAVPDGVYTLTVRDTSKGNAGTTPLLLVVAPRVPTLRAVVPSTIAAASSGMLLRLIGSDFPPKAQVAFEGSGVSVTSTRIVSPSLAEVQVAVAPDAQPGPRIAVLLSDNEPVARGATLVVLPAFSPAAAASVTTLAVVSPLSGSTVAAGEELRPHGLIATAGAGAIVGSWRIDGVPFDRFTLEARGAFPLAVAARLPVPPLARGRHRLELAVEYPQQLVSKPVLLTTVARHVSPLQILAPSDGSVLSAVPPLTRLSWSPMPGATGYEVLFREANDVVARSRVSGTELVVDAQVLKQLGEGLREWSVVPVFPGGVAGEPSPARKLAVPPRHVTISALRVERDAATRTTWLRWEGKAPGVVFRIELLAPGRTSPTFTALTRSSEYRLRAAAGWTSGARRVRVTALGPAGEELGAAETEVDRSESDAEPHLVFANDTPGPTVTSVAPPDGAKASDAKPSIEASWTSTAALDANDIYLFVDGTDVSEISEWSQTSVRHGPPTPLAVGTHTVLLRLGTIEHKWSFSVDAAAAAAAATLGVPASASSEQMQFFNDTATTETTLRRSAPEGVDNPLQPGDDTIGLQLSGLVGVESSATLKLSGDLGLRHDFHVPPDAGESWLAQENRSWLGELGVGKPGLALDTNVGYTSPSFTDQAEILTAGLTRGGFQGKAQASWLTGWYYRSFDAPTDGAASGFLLEQNVSAAALELARNPAGSLLRLVQIEVQDPDGAPAPRHKGTLRGVLAKLSFPQVDVWLEGAHSTVESLDATPPSEEPSGNAVRARLSGHTSKVNYSLTLRDTSRDFTNPANGGFTASATPGFSGDADFGYAFKQGSGSLSLGVHHLQTPVANANDAPDVRQESGNASLALGVGRPLSVILGGNLVLRRSDAYVPLTLPETDTRDLGLTATFSQAVHGLSFTEAGSYQANRNFVDPLSDLTFWAGNLSLNGTVRGILTLAMSAGWNRVAADPLLGDTDSLQFSLLPSLALVQGSLVIQPSLLYSKTHNATAASETRSEEYATGASWTPLALKSILALQVQLDWSRFVANGVTDGFIRTLTANLALSWGSTGSRPIGGAAQALSPGARQAWAARVPLAGRPSGTLLE